MTETIHQDSAAAATARKKRFTDEERFEQNRGLVYSTIKKYIPESLYDEDARQIGAIGLWKACRTYNEQISKFSTYATRCIYSELWRSWHASSAKKRKTPPSISLDSAITDDDCDCFSEIVSDISTSYDFQSIEEMADIERILRQFSPQQKKVAYLRMEGFSYSEIEVLLHIHRCSVVYDLQVLRKGLQVLR